MKYPKNPLIALAIALFVGWLIAWAEADDTPVMVDLDDPVQAALAVQIDSARSERLAAAAQRMADEIDSLYLDSILVAHSVAVLADDSDSVWVQVDVPLSSATGLERAFWAGVVQEFLDDNAQAVSTGRIRTENKAAIRGLQRLSAVLALSQ